MNLFSPPTLELLAIAAAVITIGAGGVPAAARGSSAPVPKPIAGQGYVLVKDWDFSKNVTDLQTLRDQFFFKYQYSGGTCDHFNDEWERFSDNNNHVLDGKTLSLVARAPGGLVNGGIQSGMIRTKWVGEYGYFEASIKVPKGRGMWPAFWLNSQDEKWPPEIDIFEIVNSGTDTTKNSFHFIHPSKNYPQVEVSSILNSEQSYVPGFDYSDGFHTFSCLWTPQTVTQFVDGVAIVTRKMQWLHDDGTDGGAACLMVGLAVGGKWPGPPLSLDEFPAALQVQWVRVWQNPTISKNDGVGSH